MNMSDATIEEYVLSHIDKEPEVLAWLTRETHLRTLKPRMLSGHLQGRMLKMFCAMMSAKRILEIGTFTGYSAICMAEALPEDGELHTMEVNDEMEEFLNEVFERSGMAEKIHLHIGDASQLIPQLEGQFDVVFMDGNKRHYSEYFDVVFPKLRLGGLLIADNTLWDGHVLEDSKDAQTVGIQKFNDKVFSDERVERVIVPVRDGMTLVRKIKE
ncbi:MAG: class I SAM-dependent methyltransferase [Paludibacteraceae bacterium]|nr:class I SAM-dependent methyltransferase [Paludibacteraceae bacterium]